MLSVIAATTAKRTTVSRRIKMVARMGETASSVCFLITFFTPFNTNDFQFDIAVNDVRSIESVSARITIIGHLLFTLQHADVIISLDRDFEQSDKLFPSQ